MSVPVQAPGTYIGLSMYRPLIIKPVPVDSLMKVKPVAFVRPPCINACPDQIEVLIPVREKMTFIQGITPSRRD